jgi:hypothetical protein
MCECLVVFQEEASENSDETEINYYFSLIDQYLSGVKYSFLYSDLNWSTSWVDWNMQNTSQEKESNVSEKYCCIVFFLLVSTIEKIKGFYLIIKIW